MADCNDVSRQMIEYRGLFDLKDAQVIRAEIVSINSTNNTAEVTLLDECAFDDWLDVTAIPFDYLCEGNEERTVEALAYGYKAFTNGDIVYILLTPEYTDYPAQAYIIGHVDIRDTKPCSREIIYIQLEIKINGEYAYIYSLYSPATGAIIDINSFENYDENSPEKPSSSIGLLTNEIEAWINYNFIDVIPLVSIPYSISSRQNYSDSGFSTVVLENEIVAYTGTAWKISSNGDACQGFNLGNEYYSKAYKQESTKSGGESKTEDINNTGSGCGTFHYGDGSENNCSMYWQRFSNENIQGFNSGNTFGYTIVDEVLGESKNININCSFTITTANTVFCDGETYSGNTSKKSVFDHHFDYSSIGGSIWTNNFLLYSSADISTNGPGVGDSITMSPISCNGEQGMVYGRTNLNNYQPGVVSLFYSTSSGTAGSTFIIGNEGVYGVIGSTVSVQYYDLHVPNDAVCVIGQYPNIVDGVPGWGKGVSFGPSDQNVKKYRPMFSVTSKVTFYDSAMIDTSVNVSIFECISKADSNKSESFANAIVDCIDYAYSLVDQNDAIAVDGITSELWDFGPRYRLIKKKGV